MTEPRWLAPPPMSSILDAVGHTPMVRLLRTEIPGKARIFAKCEFMNPGGSIKDRVARFMIRDARKRKLLPDDGEIVEATSGNTGIALAQAAAVLGYKFTAFIPQRMSLDKKDVMEALGAYVFQVPDDTNYLLEAENYARRNNAWFVNQYKNNAGVLAHYRTTGPEIWEQMKGQISVFVAGVGTGGTLLGVSRYLKERAAQQGALPGRPNVTAVIPEGSFLSKTRHKFKVEGIGTDFYPSLLRDQGRLVDCSLEVTDDQAFSMVDHLSSKEGIFVGGASGAAVFGAVEASKELGGTTNVVTVLTDTGRNYFSKRWGSGGAVQA